MDVSKNLFKSSLIYFVGQVLSKIIAFLLVPIYTNYLTPESLGYYELSITVLGIAVPVIFMEIWTATLRFSIETNNYKDRLKVVNNAVIVAIVGMLIYSLLYFGVALVYKFDLPIWIYVYSVVWVIQLMILSIARAHGANALYATSGVISVFFNAIITIATVLLTNGNVTSLYLGMIVSMLVQILIIDKKLKVFYEFTFSDFDWNLMKSLIVFSVPLCFNSVAYFMMEGFNKVVIQNVLGLATLGVYAAGNKISVALNLLISVFSLSWQETIFRISDQNEKQKIYNTTINLLIKVVGTGVVLLMPVISILFPYIVGFQYQSARNLIPFLLLVIFGNAIISIIASCFAAENDNKSNLYARIVACVVNVIVLLLAIDHIGFYASGIALFLGSVAGIIVQLVLIRKHIVLKIKKSNLVIFIIMFIVSFSIYLNEGLLINVTWLIIASIFCMVYLKEFLFKILHLATDFRNKK